MRIASGNDEPQETGTSISATGTYQEHRENYFDLCGLNLRNGDRGLPDEYSRTKTTNPISGRTPYHGKNRNDLL